ncbi:MAG: GatB/YqeY domain-containing protein [Patescibacteria group bacterium]
MASLRERLSGDLNRALKSKEELKVQTLRLLLSAIHNREIEKRGKGLLPELSDDEVLEVIAKEGKKRKEARELYLKGGRPELALKEAAELKLLENYLPAQLGEGEIEKIINGVFAKLNPQSEKDFGRVMAEAMKELKGKADAALVSRAVKERIAKRGDN